jgi:hypothetical protein
MPIAMRHERDREVRTRGPSKVMRTLLRGAQVALGNA